MRRRHQNSLRRVACIQIHQTHARPAAMRGRATGITDGIGAAAPA